MADFNIVSMGTRAVEYVVARAVESVDTNTNIESIEVVSGIASNLSQLSSMYDKFAVSDDMVRTCR